ncbi:unnamed protein product [Heligmosomoides polygyrus]|uniref:Cytochrome P450 n=1 Tax=Heligmosomoides polygyrus TaxID=6339 RepID=A0A183GWQ2_HELPZ|nr:unnamed protein product [Heligmosomoides polygyrus]
MLYFGDASPTLRPVTDVADADVTTRDVQNFRFRVPNSGFRPFWTLPFRSVFRLFLGRKAETEMGTGQH